MFNECSNASKKLCGSFRFIFFQKKMRPLIFFFTHNEKHALRSFILLVLLLLLLLRSGWQSKIESRNLMRKKKEIMYVFMARTPYTIYIYPFVRAIFYRVNVRGFCYFRMVNGNSWRHPAIYVGIYLDCVLSQCTLTYFWPVDCFECARNATDKYERQTSFNAWYGRVIISSFRFCVHIDFHRTRNHQ